MAIRTRDGVLVAPRLRRCQLADYAAYAEEQFLEEIKSLAGRLAGLRVLHLSSGNSRTDPVPADLPSLVTLEREVGVDSEWLVPAGDPEVPEPTRANWWPDLPEWEWSCWISSNVRAARGIERTWDVVVVHGPSLAGVAAIAPDKGGVWLWQPPCGALVPDTRRATDFLASYSGFVGQENGAGATVDPLAPFNVRLPTGVAKRIGRILDLETNRPFLCHIARFAPWSELDDVIAAYWEAKSVVAELQLVIGGTGEGARDMPGHEGVVARASEDRDLKVLPCLSPLTVACLRNCASIIVRGPAATGATVDLREGHWVGRRVLAWQGHARAPGAPVDGHTLTAANSVGEAGVQIAELLMSEGVPLCDTRGYEAVHSNHLIIHGLRDWLRTLDGVIARA